MSVSGIITIGMKVSPSEIITLGYGAGPAISRTPGGGKSKGGKKKRIIYDDLNVDYDDIEEVKEMLDEIPAQRKRKAKETAAKAAKLLTTSSMEIEELQRMAKWWAKTVDSEIAKNEQLAMRLFEAHVALVKAQWNEEDEILLLLLH